MNRGFTVVEILVTLVVIGILLGLGTVGLRSTIISGRDAERKADIETIARGLEAYYARGNPYFTAGETRGSYPGSNVTISLDGSGWCESAFFKNAEQAAKYSVCRRYWTEALPGVSDAAMTPPGKTGPDLRNPWLQSENNPVQIMMPSITNDINNGSYVYKPLTSDNSHCYGDTDCKRFALIYKKEATGEVVIVQSRHQQ